MAQSKGGTPECKAPASANLAGASRDLLCGASLTSSNLLAYRLQLVASRYALPLETAAIVAALAFGSAHHG